jgi:hypothetical protein
MNGRLRFSPQRPPLLPERSSRGACAEALLLPASLLLLCAAFAPGAARGQDEAPASADVPAALIGELNSLAIPPEKAVAESVKRRQYRKILRLGDEAVSKHPQARNLPLVWSAMLDAAQGLALLDRDEEARQRMFELAGKLAASEARPALRLVADLVLTHGALAQAPKDSPEAALAVARFADRYAGTEAEANSLMCAARLAFEIAQQRLYRFLLQKLTHFRGEPGVVAFLRGRVYYRWNPLGNQFFEGRLPRLGGGALLLPGDMLGHHTVVAFWSAATPDLAFKMAPLTELQKTWGDAFKVVGVNVDRQRFAAESCIRKFGWEWLHVGSALGPDDPVFLRYGASNLPHFCVIRADGKIAGDRADAIEGCARNGGLAQAIIFLRCGEYLVVERRDPEPLRREPEPATEPAGRRIPVETLSAIRAGFAAPLLRYRLTDAESAQRYATVLKLGEEAEKKHPGSPDLARVRAWMLVAAQGLDILKTPLAPPHRARPIAERLLASGASKEQNLLAQACLTRERVRAETEGEAAEARVREFVEAYKGSPRENEALACAAILAREAANEELQDELLGLLRPRAAEDRRLWEVFRILGSASEAGRPFRARLPLLDGGALAVPEDLGGRLAIVCFFSLPLQGEARESLLEHLRQLRDWQRDQDPADVQVIAVSLDEDARGVKECARREGWTWPVAWSGRGWRDPVAETYGDWAADRYPHALLLDARGMITCDLRPSNGGSYRWWRDYRHQPPQIAVAAAQSLKQIYLDRATAAMKEERYADAEKGLNRVLAGAPPHGAPVAWLARARARAGQKKSAAALEDLNLLLKPVDLGKQGLPNADEAYALRARLLEEAGKKAEAERDRQAAEQWRARLASARQRAQTTKDEHVRRWTVAGPFGLTCTQVVLGPQHPDGLLPPERKLDLAAACTGEHGAKLVWKTVAAGADEYVNLESVCGKMDCSAAFAAAYVHSPLKQACRATLGCECQTAVSINGQAAHLSSGNRPAYRNQEEFTVELNAGWNQILLRLMPVAARSGFYFRIAGGEQGLRFALRPEE